jgi:hypothetical protein
MRALDGDIAIALSRLGHADILIGIPSYNSAGTIGHVVAQSAAGLSCYLTGHRKLILVSDGGSIDGTLSIAKNTPLPRGVQLLTCRYQGIPGKGSAVKAIFEAAMIVGATSVAMLDSDLRSVTPSWVKLLICPTMDGAGLVAPRYVRHKYDGTITNQLCYPLTRALYGKRIRQPIGGDFGLSGELVKTLVGSSLWENPYVPRFGIDIFITSSALAQGFAVEEADLGVKIHEAKDPALQLASMFREVAGSALVCMQEYEKSWRHVRGSSPVRLHSNELSKGEPPTISVDLERLIHECRSAYSKSYYFRSVLSPELRRRLDSTISAIDDDRSIPTDVWANTVYEVSTRFKTAKENERSQLLEGLRSIWTARVITFVAQAASMTNEEAEMKVEEEAAYFEETKSQLLARYDAR